MTPYLLLYLIFSFLFTPITAPAAANKIITAALITVKIEKFPENELRPAVKTTINIIKPVITPINIPLLLCILAQIYPPAKLPKANVTKEMYFIASSEIFPIAIISKEEIIVKRTVIIMPDNAPKKIPLTAFLFIKSKFVFTALIKIPPNIILKNYTQGNS